jgi:hypothetical protein
VSAAGAWKLTVVWANDGRVAAISDHKHAIATEKRQFIGGNYPIIPRIRKVFEFMLNYWFPTRFQNLA